jgi:hypothetical protein
LKEYLESCGQEGLQAKSEELAITDVRVRRAHSEGAAYNSGEKIWVDVEVECKCNNETFSVVLFVNDDRQYEAFHTSTEYLGHPPISLKPGERFACTFELDLNLAGGTFYLGVELFRFNNERTLHRLFPATTLFVNTLTEVRGVANPHPRITAFGPATEVEPRKEAITL